MNEFQTAREAMVDCQVRPSDVTRLPIIDAMLAVPREKFVPASRRPVAYADEDIAVSHGRWLLAPRVFAKMLDAVGIGPGDAVLDIGCATGYSTAVIARQCRSVIGTESDAELVELAESNLAAISADNAVIVATGPADGLAEHGPFDVIVIEGGVGRVPEALYDQLNEGGRLVAIHVRGKAGQARLALKSGGRITDRWIFDATAPMVPGFEAELAFSL